MSVDPQRAEQPEVTEAVQRLVQWATERREWAEVDLENSTAAEDQAREAVTQAEKAAQRADGEDKNARDALATLGPNPTQEASDRVTAAAQAKDAAASDLAQARQQLADAAARKRCAEATLRSRNNSYQEFLRAIEPRTRNPFLRWVTWAFSGDRWIQVGLSLLVLLSMWFVWLTSGDQIAKDDYARGLITLLFGVGTITIALILTLTALFLGGLSPEDRFKHGMQILTILIGVFGTIMGFYFGSLNKPGGAGGSPPAAQEKEKTEGKDETPATKEPEPTTPPGAPAAKKPEPEADAKTGADATTKKG